jgi:hypothetical protein
MTTNIKKIRKKIRANIREEDIVVLGQILVILIDKTEKIKNETQRIKKENIGEMIVSLTVKAQHLVDILDRRL